MGSSAILPGRSGKFRGSAILSWHSDKLGGGRIFGTHLFDAFLFFGTCVLVLKAQEGCIVRCVVTMPSINAELISSLINNGSVMAI